MNRFFYITLIFITGFVGISCSKFEKIRRSEDINTKLEAAYKYFEEKDYYKSGILLDEMVPLLKGKETAEKANFYRAQTYFYQKQYLLAAFYFKDFYDTYSRSEYAEEALFFASKSLYFESPRHDLDQSYSYDALRALQKFANRYPKSPLVTEANTITDELNKKLEIKAFSNAKLYFELGNNNNIHYRSAVVSFGSFQRQFPASEFIEEAAYLQIDAQYRLAFASVQARQEERYLEAIEFYQNFVDKYPNSKYKSEAETVYKKALEKLEKIRSLQ